MDCDFHVLWLVLVRSIRLLAKRERGNVMKCACAVLLGVFLFLLGAVFGVFTNVTIFQPQVKGSYRFGNDLFVTYSRNPIAGTFVKRDLSLALSEDSWVEYCQNGGYSSKEREMEMHGRKSNIRPKRGRA
jgi:hypothetical protein